MAAGAGASEASPKMYLQSGRPDVLEGLEIEAVEAELPGLGRHPQVLAGPLGRLHGALEIVEVGSGDEPGIDAGLAAQQEDVEPVPAPDAVLASEPHLQREVALVLQRADTRRGQERHVLGVEQLAVATGTVELDGGADVVARRPVVVEGHALRPHDPDLVRHRIEDLMEASCLERCPGRHPLSARLRAHRIRLPFSVPFSPKA